MVKFKEAQHYKKLPNKQVMCNLCPHQCVIGNGEVGKCKVRMNIIGNLKSMSYAKPHTVKYSKIENIPLYHFFPNKEILEIGTVGENLFGELYYNQYSGKTINQVPTLTQTPKQIIKQVEKTKVNILAYTSNEPLISYEYIKDISDNFRRGKHILVTSGFIESMPIKEIIKNIGAVVIDIKSMNESFYENVLKINLDKVLIATKLIHDNNVWVEIKMSLYPGVHDNLYDVNKLVSWMLNNLDSNTPLHLINKGIDPEMLKKAKKVSNVAGLNYVYTHQGAFSERTTFCPNCKKELIIRKEEEFNNYLKQGKCSCGKEIAGIWQ